MRSVPRIDVTGTTDSSGNATIRIPLQRTGEWRIVKLAVGMSGAGEWALLSGTTPLTYGRGRRVTLGPELLQPEDSLTLTVASGPINAAILGSLSIESGSEAEMLAAYSPQPNTIALDVTAQRLPLYPDGTPASSQGAAPAFPSFIVPALGSVTKTFTILPTQTNLRVMVVGSTQYRATVTGHQTGESYLTTTAVIGFPTSALSPTRPIDIRVEPSWDPQVDVTISDISVGVQSNVYVSALFGAETTFIAASGNPIPVYIPANGAAFWQAANLRPIRVASALTAGAANAVLLLAGIAGQKIYMHKSTLALDAAVASGVASYSDGDPNAGGVSFDDFPTGALGAQPHDYGGAPLTVGNGLYIWAQLMNFTIRGFVSVSQG